MASRYAVARDISLDGLTGWHAAVKPYLGAPGARVLDVGSGTGLFARAFVEWFDSISVVCLEPSVEMRHEAARLNGSHPRIALLGGDGEHLPLSPGSCSAAWISTVIHHIRDLGHFARGLSAVIRPGGHVLIRSAFPGRVEHITLFRFFPGARRVVDTFPTVDATVSAFVSAGFEMVALTDVEQVSAPSLAAAHDRVKLRADTTLAGLSDDEFQMGLEALRKAVEQTRQPAPVVDHLDLLVLQRKASGDWLP